MATQIGGLSIGSEPFGFPTTTSFTVRGCGLGLDTGNRSHLILIWGYEQGSSRTITGVTLGGVACTEILTQEATNGGEKLRVSAYRVDAAIANGDFATADLVITTSAAYYDMAACVIPVYGLGTLLSSAADTTPASGVYALNVNTEAGGLVVAISFVYGSASTHVWAGLTELVDAPFKDIARATSIAALLPASSSTPLTVTATNSQADGTTISAAAIALSFSAAASGLGSGGGHASTSGGMQ